MNNSNIDLLHAVLLSLRGAQTFVALAKVSLDSFADSRMNDHLSGAFTLLFDICEALELYIASIKDGKDSR